jgi:serine/threonine protein kinase
MVYWEKGKKLNGGKYIVEEILGSGGFGVNYKVIKTRNQEIFVIKTLNALARSKPNFGQLQDDFLKSIALLKCKSGLSIKAKSITFARGLGIEASLSRIRKIHH